MHKLIHKVFELITIDTHPSQAHLPFAHSDSHCKVTCSTGHYACEVTLFEVELVNLSVEVDVSHVNVDVYGELTQMEPMTAVIGGEVTLRLCVCFLSK